MTAEETADRLLLSTTVKEYAYVYTGGSLMQLVVKTTVDSGTPTTQTLNFRYDANGTPISVSYNGTEYFYVLNLQSDITAIVNSGGTAVVRYTYDAWGNILTTSGSMANTLGEANPLRYRGYVYDQETGLYYLQSRYYSPKIGRFINEDVFVSTKNAGLGSNLFSYCFNNPINYSDAKGTDAIWIQEWNSAGEQGHTGLMVQDEEGNWFFFYWGPSNEDEEEPDIIALCIGVSNDAYYVACGDATYQLDLRKTDAVVEVVHKMFEGTSRDRSGKITNTVYLEGDFTKTHDYLSSLCGENAICLEQYNLILNNCVQKSLYALSLSDSRFSPYHTFQTADGMVLCLPSIHPNYEFSFLPIRLWGRL